MRNIGKNHFSKNKKNNISDIFGDVILHQPLRVQRKHNLVDEFLDTGSLSNEEQRIPEKNLGILINKNIWKRVIFLFFLILLLFTVRIFDLQINKGSTYTLLADNNRLRLIPITPSRGTIFDRNGNIIVNNEPLFQLIITKRDWNKSTLQEKEKIINQLINHGISIKLSEIEKSLDKKTEFIIGEYEYNDALSLITLTQYLRGVNVRITARRAYRDPEIYSHLIGYMAPLTNEQYRDKKESYLINDYIGTVGLERQYEELLRGTLGEKNIETNAFGKEEKIISQIDPLHGKDITLTIDSEVQKKLYALVSAQLKNLGLTKGAAIVMNPKNGEILSLVSFPSFNNNSFYQGFSNDDFALIINNDDKPLFNRAINGQYPPASTFKIVIASAALKENIITPQTRFISDGGIRVSSWFFPDWKIGGHGLTNLYKAIAESVNTYFFIIGGGYKDIDGLGVSKINAYAEKFGLGRPTNIDMPNESSGFLPTPEWKQNAKNEQWYIGDTYNLSIGQGDILVTPLQMASVISIIANDGVQTTPHLLKSNSIKSSTTVLDKDVTNEIKRALRETVISGSAKSLQIVPVPVSGKTGTAEWSSKADPHAWFVGFAPYSDPEIAISIIIEEGKEGSIAAVPIAREFLYWYFTVYTNY